MPIVPTQAKSSVIVLGSYEGVISGYSFNLEDQSFTQTFGYQAHIGSVKSINISGRHLATGGTDEVIHLFDTFQLREKGGLSCHNSSITALALAGSVLLSGSQDGTICVSENKGNDWHTRLTINAHKDSVSSIAIHPSSRMALSTSPDGTLRMWDLMRGTCACVHNLVSTSTTVRTHPSQAQVSPSGNVFALLFPNKIQIGRFDSSALQTFTGGFSHLLVLSDSTIIAGDAQGALTVLSFTDCSIETLSKTEGVHVARIKGISLLQGASVIASVCTSGKLIVWQVTEESKLVQISMVESGIGRVNCMDSTIAS